MVRADLHVHTTNSDGQLTLETLPAAARDAGVSTVAITDHDRINPELDGPETTIDGITVIHGIELRVEYEDFRVDLLGYGVHDPDVLAGLEAELQANRIERARNIASLVEEEIGVSLDIAFKPGVGRPHIARAIAESDHHYGYRDAFAHLIGDGGPCYVSRNIPPFDRGRKMLMDACTLVGLAHPLRYPNPEAALSLTSELDAVELPYPYGKEVDTSPVEEVIEKENLVVTGGSDAHEETLGIAGLDADQYEAFRMAFDGGV